MIDGEIIEQVKRRKNTEVALTEDGRCVQDIKETQQMAKLAFTKNKGLLTSKNIMIDLKQNFIKTFVWGL